MKSFVPIGFEYEVIKALGDLPVGARIKVLRAEYFVDRMSEVVGYIIDTAEKSYKIAWELNAPPPGDPSQYLRQIDKFDYQQQLEVLKKRRAGK